MPSKIRTPERVAYEKKWRMDNLERTKLNNKTWREKNADVLKQKKKEYYERTKDENNARRRQDRTDNPDKYKNKDIRGKSTRQNRLKNGFTDALLAQRFVEQEYCCALCLVSFSELPSHKVHADHCHKTGIARGILCWHCNAALGQFKDNLPAVERAVEYLKKYSTGGEL